MRGDTGNPVGPEPAAEARLRFDYIVVGAGSSGCVVANRLSASGTVLLLEAGGSDLSEDVREIIHNPENVLTAIFGSPTFSKPYVTEPQDGLGGRGITVHRGVIRGGSSSINGMVYVRGNRRDYDQWAQLGNEGWSFGEVLPYFKKSENHAGGASRYHGIGGLLDVRPLPAPSELALATIQAAGELGYRDSAPDWDFNGARQEDAAGLYHVTITPAVRRASAAAAFLDPIEARGSLVVRTGVRANRLVIEAGRARGVECIEGGQRRTYWAEREIVISAGAFESPKLLMLSGIGPADELRRHGIATVVDLPGVGQNLSDHLMMVLFHPAKRDPGLAHFIAEAGLFVNTRDGSGATSPDLQYHILAAMWGGVVDPAVTPNFLLLPTLCKPQSRGQVRLRTGDPATPPLIHPNYLQSEADVRVLQRGIELGQQLARTPALKAFYDDGTPPFAVPDPARPAMRMPVPSGPASAVREFIRATVTTVWHPVGTCRMGWDRMAVVDPALRVHGVQGLRIADASVMPIITSGNTNAACIMIGEKCADVVLGVGLPGAQTSRGWITHGSDLGSDYANLIELLSRVMPIYAASGLRFWARAAELWAKALPAIAATLADPAAASTDRPNPSARLIGEIRAYVQALADLPPQEARLLKADLERVAAALEPDLGRKRGDDHGTYWRRWKAKP